MNIENLKELRRHGSDNFPIALYDSTLSIAYHWHNEDEFIYMEKGSAEYSIGREKLVIKAGEAAFCGGRTLHSLILDDGAKFKALVYNRSYIFGTNDICRKYLNKTIKKHYTPDIASHSEIIETLNEICNNINNQSYGYETEVKYKLLRLHSLIIQNNLYEETTANETPFEKSLLTVIEYIHKNYSKKLYIDELAAIVGYSAVYFEKLFKAYIGKSPSEYIMIYRLNSAQRYLTETDYSVLEIAQMCGFPNVSYFIRTFRKFCNTTPHKYRQGKMK